MANGLPPYASLILVILMAFAVPIVIARFRTLRIPVVVGEILAGLVVGRSGLGLIQEPGPVLTFLSDFGLAYLMFLSGLELDLSALVPTPRTSTRAGWLHWLRSSIVLAGAAFLVTLVIALWAAQQLTRYDLLPSPWLAGFILATSALGIVLPTLKERNLTSTGYGQTLLAYASLADFATMVLVALYVATQSGSTAKDVILVLLLFVAFLIAYRLSSLVRREPLIRRLLDAATGHFDVRAAMALIVVFIALAEQLGVESILGAFLAGTIVSLVMREEGELSRTKLDALGHGFFVPMFFITFGAQFDLWSAARSGETWLLLTAFLVVTYVSKLISALLFLVRHSWREAMGGGALVASQLSLTIVAADIGQRIDLFDATTVAAFVLMAIVSAVVSPIAFAHLVPDVKGGERGIVIVGDGELAGLLAERLAHLGKKVTLAAGGPFLQREWPPLVRAIRLQDDAAATFHFAHAEEADTLVVLFDDDARNTEWVGAALKSFKIRNVVTCVDDPKTAVAMREAGVRVVQRALSLISLLQIAVHAPEAMEMLTGQDQTVHVEEVIIRKAAIHGKPLRAAGLPRGNLAITLRRGQQRLIPDGDTVLQLGDHLTLVGTAAGLEAAAAHLGKEAEEA